MKRFGLLLCLLLLLAACGQQGPPQNDITRAFIGGNKALDIGLIDGMPPAAIYDNDRMRFGVGVVLQNVGEADIGADSDNPFVRVALEGFSPRRYDITVDQMSKDLFASRPFLGSRKNFDGSILPGQIESVVFEDLAYQDRLQGNHIEHIVVTACYDYQNYATAELCFKDEVFEFGDDICTLTGEKLPQNSGGPLHVTSLVQNPLGPNRIMIGFNLEHLGTGDFFGREPDEDCNPAIINTNKYRVDVEVASPDPSMAIDCSSFQSASSGNSHSGRITLFAGAPTSVVCTLEATGASSRIFTEPITITTSYRYSERIRQPIVIQAVGDR